MVYRVYVEKKPGFDHEASSLLEELRDFLRIEGLKRVRVINRYDVEDIDPALFEAAVPTIFSEPPLDQVLEHLPQDVYKRQVGYSAGRFRPPAGRPGDRCC